jgi:hypothetical protein
VEKTCGKKSWLKILTTAKSSPASHAKSRTLLFSETAVKAVKAGPELQKEFSHVVINTRCFLTEVP